MNAEAGLGVQTVDTGLVFEYLLGEELAFERDLSERRNLVDVPLRNGLVFATDEHGHVSCHVGAIVDKEDGRGFSIVFDPPLVDRLVGGDGQRPLADRVRVCSYLVRLSCKAVGLLGGTLRFDSDPVGFLSGGDRRSGHRRDRLNHRKEKKRCGSSSTTRWPTTGA